MLGVFGPSPQKKIQPPKTLENTLRSAGQLNITFRRKTSCTFACKQGGDCFVVTLPETNIAPEKWMVGIQSFPFGIQKTCWLHLMERTMQPMISPNFLGAKNMVPTRYPLLSVTNLSFPQRQKAGEVKTLKIQAFGRWGGGFFTTKNCHKKTPRGPFDAAKKKTYATPKNHRFFGNKQFFCEETRKSPTIKNLNLQLKTTVPGYLGQ